VGDSEFVGYDTTDTTAAVVGIIEDGRIVEETSASGQAEFIVDRTPFYAEAGGQIGDMGQAVAEGVRADVLGTRAPVGGMYVHTAQIRAGTVRVGAKLELRVDEQRRAAIRRNHSATHLLHHALRTVLGPHVVQKGSLVAPDRLRFDYSHAKAMTDDERVEVERLVNLKIRKNIESRTDIMELEEAQRIGATGLFGEKYGEHVRVVRIGDESIELCGGTHVRRTGDIGVCLMVSEASIAQGVRRIEAVTGQGALEHVQRLGKMADDAGGLLHAGGHAEIPDRIGRLQADLKQSEKTIADLRRQLVTGGAGAGESVVEVDGVKLLAKRVAVTDSRTLREAADALRARLGSGVVVLGAEAEGKATVLVAVTKDLEGRVHAGKLAGQLARHVDGRGGGRPDLAQAGGPKTAGLDEALQAAESDLAAQLRAV
jgi:alanyl-tRNA synthetase